MDNIIKNNIIIMKQKKNKFDQETLIKILKGAGIAGGGVASVYILEALSVMDFGNSSVLVAGLCAILINAIKEYMKGK
ncbi:MAG: hypothetical protein PF549_04795 [Patescibacteria group bacterium]|nr:hypothetical protein [Patescibacteria group bacterium]